MTEDTIRTDWTREEITDLFDLPFDELMWEAQGVHRRHHARGTLHVRVAADDHGSVAAQLQRDALEVAGRQLRELPAHGHRAGEADLADDVGGDQLPG